MEGLLSKRVVHNIVFQSYFGIVNCRCRAIGCVEGKALQLEVAINSSRILKELDSKTKMKHK